MNSPPALLDLDRAEAPEVAALDPREVLEAVVADRRAADRAEAHLLALAVHWVDLHPVTDQAPAATWSAGEQFAVGGRRADCPLAGDGTPGVACFAVEELAGALGLSYAAGLSLVSESVELRFRLPRLWALVQEGSLQAWKARQVARETTHLSRAAVDFVDRHAAVSGRTNRLPRVAQLVQQARLRCDPEQAAEVERAARDQRGVWFDFRDGAVAARVTAALDLPDAVGLDASLAALATTLGRLGDERSLDVRRASALGLLADPQGALDLLAGEPASSRAPVRGGARATLYLHVSPADLATTGSGSVERLGPASLELLGEWLARIGEFTVQPVLDPRRSDAVDRHDPPPWMREVVVLRDRHCVFPGCTADARSCDLDHIEPFVSPETGGPPGQTSADRLACLCRRHHRLKTFRAWRYRRRGDGSYEWTDPYGHVLTVIP